MTIRHNRLNKQNVIVAKLWQNDGIEVPQTERPKIEVWKNGIYEVKPLFWQRKNPENQWFSGFFGGDKRDRTADLLNAIQALSQLSYTPIFGLLLDALPDSFCIIAHTV